MKVGPNEVKIRGFVWAAIFKMVEVPEFVQAPLGQGDGPISAWDSMTSCHEELRCGCHGVLVDITRKGEGRT